MQPHTKYSIITNNTIIRRRYHKILVLHYLSLFLLFQQASTAMGRITIFALSECPHCQRTKSTLKSHDLPYTEISLTTHPYKRTDMLQLSDRLTVPQVFFNEEHIGGADDTLAVLQRWQVEITAGTSPHKTLLERYQAEIGSKPDPSDARLQVPTEPPVVEEEYKTETIVIDLPNGTKATVREVTELLKQSLPIQDRKYQLTIYKQSFTGQDFLKTIMEKYDITDNTVALEFAKKLQHEHQIVFHVTGDAHDIDDSSKYYFRLQCHQNPLLLNSYCMWKRSADTTTKVDATALLKHCKGLWSKVAKAVTDDQGRIDYKNAPSLEQYSVFEEAVCELQCVDWSTMDRNTKLVSGSTSTLFASKLYYAESSTIISRHQQTFGINLYNLMIPYAFSKVGIGTSTLARGAFFNTVSMNVGGHVLSFTELENGVLRGNRKAPYAFSKPFGNQDARLQLALEQPDERIHFGLNCGATSCPPVKVYTVPSIEEELRIVAMAFCEQDSNVLVDPTTNTLSLSAIFKWYRADFDPQSDNTALATKVLGYVRGTKRDALQSMLDGAKKNSITVKYLPYDWGTNASEFVPFDSSKLKVNVMTVLALF